MDGLAAGVGAIAATFLGINFLLAGDMGLAGVSFSFTGALPRVSGPQLPAARIFMGDSGALFVGLLLAGLALSPTPGLSRSLFAVVIVPAVVLAVPILDTTFVNRHAPPRGPRRVEGGQGSYVARTGGSGHSRKADRVGAVGPSRVRRADRPGHPVREPHYRVPVGWRCVGPPHARRPVPAHVAYVRPRRPGEPDGGGGGECVQPSLAAPPSIPGARRSDGRGDRGGGLLRRLPDSVGHAANSPPSWPTSAGRWPWSSR